MRTEMGLKMSRPVYHYKLVGGGHLHIALEGEQEHCDRIAIEKALEGGYQRVLRRGERGYRDLPL